MCVCVSACARAHVCVFIPTCSSTFAFMKVGQVSDKLAVKLIQILIPFEFNHVDTTEIFLQKTILVFL